ncbi:MAG: TRAP transporter substrate-binding protein DctP [Deltaproteobacteria bacterium]|nr:TRAP transporter substrate-binding protein DctP [Deltaproteobacteria bacterium]MBW2017838.1 TRAP transporter substrate-binding protein DctP [Deltaproteobacteria bacterium]MBW2129049.1 TRAP transporter substrate-binding protein DctP [Deltaproteobacteria bacterium]MBW2303048.1 TRAP transporter substrate-binding protein DctP [Deltaproteobacteria bacterium]
MRFSRDLMKRSFLCVVVLAFLAGGILGATPCVAKEIKWRMQCLFPGGDYSYEIQAKGLVKALNEGLKGKLKITLFQPGQIIPAEEMFNGLSMGVYDAAYTAPAWAAQTIPEAIVAFGLPMGWQNAEQDLEFFDKFGGLDYIRKAYAKHNIFFAYPMPTSLLPIMGNFPIHKMSDLKGKKVWSEGPTALYVKAAGGKPMAFPPEDLYMALKLGTVDGFIYSTAELKTAKYAEVVKYVNLPPVIFPLNTDFICNMDSWKKLPKDVQVKFMEIVRKAAPEIYAAYAKANQDGIDYAVSKGVKIVNLNKAEMPKMISVAKQVWDETAAQSPETAQYVEMLKNFLKAKGIEIPK